MEDYINIVVCSSVFMLGMAACMTVFLVSRRFLINRKSKKEGEIKSRLQDFLSSFLLLPVDNALVGIQQNNTMEYGLEPKLIQKTSSRLILAEEIYNLQKVLCGIQRTQVINYFLGVGLHQETLTLLKSTSRTKKIKALQWLRGLDLKKYIKEVLPFINHSNPDVAIEALLTSIHLENSMAPLSLVKRSLTSWDLHKVYHLVRRNRMLMKELQEYAQTNNLSCIDYMPNPDSEQLYTTQMEI